MTDESGRPRSGASREREADGAWQTVVGTISRSAAGAIAILGVLWFGLLSVGAAIVYTPLGVRPSEIGLGSGTVLGQSAVALIVLLVLYGLVAALWAIGLSRVKSRRRRSTLPVLLAAIALVFAASSIFDAFYAREHLEKGKVSPRPLPWLPGTWSGEVADLAWAHSPPSLARSLPRCALYLGAAGGTSVIYDATAKQTWRIPSSELIVTELPNRKKCP
jgi:hypothetical protein